MCHENADPGLRLIFGIAYPRFVSQVAAQFTMTTSACSAIALALCAGENARFL